MENEAESNVVNGNIGNEDPPLNLDQYWETTYGKEANDVDNTENTAVQPQFESWHSHVPQVCV